MKIVIPMSGIGKRFINAGYDTPKPLLSIEGKPIIEHVCRLFPGEISFVFICNDLHLHDTPMRAVLESIVIDPIIVEVPVGECRGPVEAVLRMPAELFSEKEEMIVSYCDYGTKWDYEAFLKEMRSHKADGGIAAYIGFHPHMLGTDNYAFLRHQDMEMLEIREKQPFTNDRMSEYASNGTYYFRTGALCQTYFHKLVDQDQTVNGEFYVSMVYNLMKQDRLCVRVFEIEKMLQWGTPKDLEEYLVWSNYFLHRKDGFWRGMMDQQDTTLVLPMAGAGSRFFTAGYDVPKPLLGVEKKPMIVRAVECLPPTSRKIFICQKKHLEAYDLRSTILREFPESKILGIDGITEGQACTCRIALDRFPLDDDKPLLISACDNGIYYDVEAYERLLGDDTIDLIIFSFSGKENPTCTLYPNMYAWLDVDENGYIRAVSVKKPFPEPAKNHHVIIGTMFFRKTRYFLEGYRIITENDIRTNGEFYVDDMIQPLIEKGLRCKNFPVFNYLCWGTPNDYQTYQYWYEYFCTN